MSKKFEQAKNNRARETEKPQGKASKDCKTEKKEKIAVIHQLPLLHNLSLCSQPLVRKRCSALDTETRRLNIEWVRVEKSIENLSI